MGLTKFRSKKNLVQKNVGLVKICPPPQKKKIPYSLVKIGVGNSGDIVDMDKCHQDKCFVGKSHHDS